MTYVINREKVRWRVVDGEAVLINTSSSYYYTLNATGTFIWELLLSGPQPFETILERVTENFKVGARVEGDIRALLTQLAEEQLVSEVEP